MSKTYRWETEREREQAVFLEAVVKTYKGWVGKLPRMTGFTVRSDPEPRAGGEFMVSRSYVALAPFERHSPPPLLSQTRCRHPLTLFDDPLTTPPLLLPDTEVVRTQEDLSTAALNTATLPILPLLPLCLRVLAQRSPPLGRQPRPTPDKIPTNRLGMGRQEGDRA